MGLQTSPVIRIHVFVCALDARSRGVLFDVGHGMGSFDFHVTEAAIVDGFPPVKKRGQVPFLDLDFFL